MSQYLYAHRTKFGVKIGSAHDYKSRKAHYLSHGGKFKEIRVININNVLYVESKLHEFLKKLNLHIKKENLELKSNEDFKSIEVFDLKTSHVNKIFNYIKEHNTVTFDIVKSIVIDDWYHKKILLSDFRELYGFYYIDFNYQRPIDLDHVESLKKYMCECYQSVTFRLPEITAIKLTEDKYTIIDGSHRCKAILAIDNTHPILDDCYIIISQKDNIMTEADAFQLFRSINKGKPMSDIYLNEYCIRTIVEDLITKLKKEFNQQCVRKESTNSGLQTYITERDIEQFVTEENIHTLFNMGLIKELKNNDLFKVLVNLNTKLEQIIATLAGGEYILSDPITEITDQNITDKQWNREVEFCRILNEYKMYKIAGTKKIFERIRLDTCKTNRNIKNKNRKKDPFLLGLIQKVELIYCIEKIPDIIKELGLEDSDE